MKIPMHDIACFLWEEWRSSVINTRANSIAFSFFLSIFPTIIVLFTLIAYTPLYVNFKELIFDTVHDLMPGNAEKWILKAVEDLGTKKRDGLLSLSFLLALYFSTNGVVEMMNAFQKTLKGTFRRYSFFEKRYIAIKLTALLGVLLFASVAFGIMGDIVVKFLAKIVKINGFSKIMLSIFRYLLMLILLYGGISIIYRYGMPLRKKLPFVNPGVTIATFLSIATSLVFSFYVDNFGNYNKLYESFGTPIVLMIWLQLNVYIILIGFELNASIAVNRDLKYEETSDEAPLKSEH